MQCHCVHRRTQRDTDTATLRTDTHTHGPARDTGPGGTARTEVQGMLSDRILPGNTQNAAPGMLMPSLDPASPPSLIPLRELRNPQQHDNPMPKTPWSGSPVSSSAPSRASRPGRFPMRCPRCPRAVPGPGCLPVWPGRADVRLLAAVGDGWCQVPGGRVPAPDTRSDPPSSGTPMLGEGETGRHRWCHRPHACQPIALCLGMAQHSPATGK